MPIQWHRVTAMSIDEVENQPNNDLVQTATNLVEKLVKAKDKKKLKIQTDFDGSTEAFAKKIPKRLLKLN